MSEGQPSCLFCAIVAGQIPAAIVATSEDAVAFRDIEPGAPLHVLVVPREHVDDVREIDATSGATLGALVALANEVAEAEGVAESGYRLVLNVGADAGQSVGHLHLHLLGGRKLEWPPG